MRQTASQPSGRSVCSTAVTASALIVLLSLASGCGEEPPGETAPVVRPVKTMAIHVAGSAQTLEYPGRVAPAQNADVSFEVPGRIVQFPVNEGEPVAEGQLLARLDPEDFQSRVDREVARQNAAIATYNRVRGLYESGASSAQDLDVARRDKEVTDSAVRTARKALNDTRLLASFDGTVARTLVDNFTNVAANQPVLVLQDNSSLEIEVDVPERDWVNVKPGMTVKERNEQARVSASFGTIPGRSFAARLKEAATSADPTTRTYRTTLAFDPPDDVQILPGMTARVNVVLPADTGAAPASTRIPSNATAIDAEGNAFVWRLDPQTMKVHKTIVQLGRLSGDRVEVISGLDDGVEIAVTGVSQLAEGMAVRRLDQ